MSLRNKRVEHSCWNRERGNAWSTKDKIMFCRLENCRTLPLYRESALSRSKG
jgi:hypothetical protein